MDENEILIQALRIESEVEREAFLKEACENDPEKLASVKALLALEEELRGKKRDEGDVETPDQSDSLLATTGHSSFDESFDQTLTIGRASDESLPNNQKTQPFQRGMSEGTVIAGRYVLQGKIGEGGMGEVWNAKQVEPVKRKVALKLIKKGMDSRAVLTRFEQERQALALMDHPNIASVLDGGVTDSGQPFFVMELVNGLPLNKFADESKLNTSQRLELFIPICNAIQHAHQKGIVHRDLKPANILVSMIDGRPVPKVIDFGVAKATGGSLTDESIETEFGAVVGTLEYMSPEQAGYTGVDVDTRADIYSLGVVLYELLTGLRPIDKKRLKEAGLAEMIRVIKEDEPSKPSTRLSTAESLPSLAATRQIDPRKLTALLKGELDWVVMKCLEKGRDRRYESATGLSRDIQRYLAGETVEARPASTSYRLSKFLRRNKGPVVAVCLVMFTLIAGIAGTTWGWLEANVQKKVAEQETSEKELARQAEKKSKLEAIANAELATSEAKRADAEKVIAQREERKAKAVVDFLQHKLLGQADSTAQANSLLRTGRSVAEFTKNPTILELLNRAAEELAEDKIESNFPDQPLVQAELLHTIGLTYYGIGETKLAISFAKRAHDLRKKHLGVSHMETLDSMKQHAVALELDGQLAEARAIFEETLRLQKESLEANHIETLNTETKLAVSYLQSGKRGQATEMLERTSAAIESQLGAEHRSTLNAKNGLAQAYMTSGKFNDAIPVLKSVLEISEKKLGAKHPQTATAMGDLAFCHLSIGDLKTSLPLSEKAVEFKKLIFGDEHPETLVSLNNLAILFERSGQLDDALAMYEEARPISEKRLSKTHPRTLGIMTNIAGIYQVKGQLKKAAASYEEVLPLMKTNVGVDHPYTLICTSNLASVYTADGKTELAIPLIKEWLKQSKDPAKKQGKLALLAYYLLQLNRFEEAESAAKDCVAIREKLLPNEWRRFSAVSLVGQSLLGQEKFDEAERELLTAYEGMKAREESIPAAGKPQLKIPIECLIRLYDATKNDDEKAKWEKELETQFPSKTGK